MSKAKKETGGEKLLTEAELELMTILWRLGEGSVAEVMADLPAGRELAYTSVSTILRILEQKGILKVRKEGRGHIYIPILAKADYEARTVKHMVSRVFGGAPLSLVKQLLDAVDLAPNEIAELRKMIEAAGKRK